MCKESIIFFAHLSDLMILMHKKKSKNQIKKSLSICLLFLLILSYFVPVTLAYDRGGFGFSNKGQSHLSEYELSSTFNFDNTDGIVFKDISYYEDDASAP